MTMPLDLSGLDEAIERLELEPHPEGGWFRETWRGEPGPDGRSVGTAIYFAVSAASPSHLHRVDAVELFHWYAGASVEQLVVTPEGTATVRRIGPDLAAGERPQAIVPTGAWQGLEVADSAGWALVGCTVSPGFEFDGFELASADTVASLLAAHPGHADRIERLRPR
jgi:predicted cupin superfamily sugar epimerase